MMDGGLIYIVLVVLTFSTALNLFLTLRLAALVRAGTGHAAQASSLPIGKVAPAFEARVRATGRRIASTEFAGQAVVLAFLSIGCPKCRATVPELARILPATHRAGVALWIAGADDVHDVADLFEGSSLVERVLVLDAATRWMLNPLRAAPFYIFFDGALVVQASSHIGDEDWRSFIAQMDEIAEAKDVAATDEGVVEVRRSGVSI
jgi:hypothetical protein